MLFSPSILPECRCESQFYLPKLRPWNSPIKILSLLTIPLVMFKVLVFPIKGYTFISTWCTSFLHTRFPPSWCFQILLLLSLWVFFPAHLSQNCSWNSSLAENPVAFVRKLLVSCMIHPCLPIPQIIRMFYSPLLLPWWIHGGLWELKVLFSVA